MWCLTIQHRIEPILTLFPDMPHDLLHQALRHPRFASHKAQDGGQDDPVTVLTNAMLDDTLPGDLKELGRRVRAFTRGQEGVGEGSGIGSGSGNGGTPADRSRQPSPDKSGTGKKTFKRDNIFNDVPMDFSKLSFGRKNDELVPCHPAFDPCDEKADNDDDTLAATWEAIRRRSPTISDNPSCVSPSNRDPRKTQNEKPSVKKLDFDVNVPVWVPRGPRHRHRLKRKRRKKIDRSGRLLSRKNSKAMISWTTRRTLWKRGCA